MFLLLGVGYLFGGPVIGGLWIGLILLTCLVAYLLDLFHAKKQQDGELYMVKSDFRQSRH